MDISVCRLHCNHLPLCYNTIPRLATHLPSSASSKKVLKCCCQAATQQKPLCVALRSKKRKEKEQKRSTLSWHSGLKGKRMRLNHEILIELQMLDLMYSCVFGVLRCSSGITWTIITLIKSTSLQESGQRV